MDPADPESGKLAELVEELPQEFESLRTTVLHKLLTAALLSLLVMVGLFLTHYDPQRARLYWTAMFPAFGLVGLWHTIRTRSKAAPLPLGRLVRETCHWLGAMVAVRVVFLQLAWGQLTANSAALMTVLLLAVTCYLAGVNFDSSYLWVSVLLGLAAVSGTNIEGYIWLIVAAAVVLVAVVLGVLFLLRRRIKERPQP